MQLDSGVFSGFAHSANLCLLTGVFDPFPPDLATNGEGLTSDILGTVF